MKIVVKRRIYDIENSSLKDYKTLKILPKELPKDPDIEKAKKEEYIFKTDDELITPVESNIETNEIDSVMPTDTVFRMPNASEPFMEIISSIVDPTISNEIDGNLGPQLTTEGIQIMIVERKDLEKTVTHQAPLELNFPTRTSDDESDLRANEDVTVFSSNEVDTRSDKENLLNLSSGGVLEGSIFETFHFDEDDDDSDSSDSDEDYTTELKTPRPTEYSSRQRSLPSSTLLHGFIANPGYPSFYIGKSSDCKWKLKLVEGQNIALTILDLHLRSMSSVERFFRKFLY